MKTKPGYTASGRHYTDPLVECNGPYHVVRHTIEDKELITYAIYVNNRVYLKPPRGKKLPRWEAYKICDLLNKMPRRKWIERPYTRDELMSVR